MGTHSRGSAGTLLRTLLHVSPALLATVLYGYTVSLPFFLDDGAHFTILDQTSGLEFWGDFPTFPFYRPLAFTLWQGYAWLAGGYDPVALHLLNLTCFALAGVLVGSIARRTLRHSAGTTAGWLFVAFPFAYQAVAMVAALFHLTLVLGLTLSAWLALLWLDRRAGAWALAGSWMVAFVAVFSHETGILVPVFTAGLIRIAYGSLPPLRRLLAVLLPVVGIAVVYLLLWLSFRPQAAGDLTTDPAGLAVLLQTLVYPVAALLRPFVEGDADPVALIALAVTTVGVVLVLARGRRAAAKLVLFGAGWHLLAILPAALFLPAGYVLGQPRLALLAWIGGALLWAALVVHWWRDAHIGGRIAASTLLLALLALSAAFLGQRRADFLVLRDYQTQLLGVLAYEVPTDDGVVLVNAPDFVTPLERDRRFLLGTEGVLFVDPAADYGLQLAINSGQDLTGRVETITVTDILRAEAFDMATHPPVLALEAAAERVRGAGTVIVTRFDDGRIWPEWVGGAALTGPSTAQVRFDGGVFTLTQAQASAEGGRITVLTRWQAMQPAPVKLFVHVYCDDAFIAQSDGYPWGDTLPFALWEAEDTFTDRRTLLLDDLTDPICLSLRVGLYREADGARLPATDTQTGDRLQDDSLVVPVAQP